MDTKKIIQNAHIEFEFCFALDRIIMVIEINILTENVEQMHKTASNNIMIYFDVDRSTLEVEQSLLWRQETCFECRTYKIIRLRLFTIN